jgi:hypothetical protein
MRGEEAGKQQPWTQRALRVPVSLNEWPELRPLTASSSENVSFGLADVKVSYNAGSQCLMLTRGW